MPFGASRSNASSARSPTPSRTVEKFTDPLLSPWAMTNWRRGVGTKMEVAARVAVGLTGRREVGAYQDDPVAMLRPLAAPRGRIRIRRVAPHEPSPLLRQPVLRLVIPGVRRNPRNPTGRRGHIDIEPDPHQAKDPRGRVPGVRRRLVVEGEQPGHRIRPSVPCANAYHCPE